MKDVIVCEGVVVFTCKDIYRVRVDLGGRSHEVLARLGGKLWSNRIRVLLGDFVTVEISPYDLTRARITKRHLDPRRRAS